MTADLILFALIRICLAELQIRRGKRDNLGIIFNITHLKCMLCDPSSENICCDSSFITCNEGSQHMFSLRNKKNYF